MHILHLEASPGWGGQEIRILRESIGMRERGHLVILAVMRGASLGKKAKEAGFVVYELNFRHVAWVATLFRLLWMIAKHRIDLINTHSSLDAWIGGIAGRIARKKIVRTRHLSTQIKPGFNSRLLYGKLADFVVTTCASIVPIISKQSGKSIDKCRSIPTGIDEDAILTSPEEVDAFQKKHRIGEKEFLIGTACFMRSWKGIEDFLKAANLLRNEPYLRWLIIGGGHAETYRQMAKDLKLEGKVIFTGHLDNPFPAIQALDVFALLSTAHEGVSQAILQAAYLRKPLIATAVGGLGEVCIDRMTGLQVAPFAPDEVAKAVLELKTKEGLRIAFGLKANALVKSHFSWKATLDQMENVYKIGSPSIKFTANL